MIKNPLAGKTLRSMHIPSKTEYCDDSTPNFWFWQLLRLKNRPTLN
jgi:hypothetical protein